MNAAPERHGDWLRKFSVALRGVRWAVSTQVNFRVHLAAASVVVIAAAWLGATSIEWCLLTLCVTTVLLGELLNTALEHLARAITRQHHEEIRYALDVAAGAVLIASLGSAITGAVVFAQLWQRHAGI